MWGDLLLVVSEDRLLERVHQRIYFSGTEKISLAPMHRQLPSRRHKMECASRALRRIAEGLPSSTGVQRSLWFG
jgi:hypothetical protein